MNADRVTAQQPAAAVPDNVTRTAPAKIWLQVDADDYQESRDAAFQSFNDECSWCSESQGGVEIGYIRADLCAQALASKAGVPEVDDEDLRVFAEAHGNPDPAVREVYRSGLIAYRARLIERMKGGGE